MGKKGKNKPGGLSGNAAKVASRLFSAPDAVQAFLDAVASGSARQKAVVWLGDREEMAWELSRRPAWLPPEIDLLEGPVNVGSSGAYGKGALYPLDASSAWEGSLLHALRGQTIRRMLDLCAAPGGKLLVARALLKPQDIYANEVIPKRAAILADNLDRCAVAAQVIIADSSQIAEQAEGCFDLVLVDAPCSGQSLIARGKENPGAFHEKIRESNALRQRRIVSNAARCVAPGGWILYTTCTYSLEENEGLLKWFFDRNPEWRAVMFAGYDEFRSAHATFPCYRAWPHQAGTSQTGAGGFAALLRCPGERAESLAEPDLDHHAFRRKWTGAPEPA